MAVNVPDRNDDQVKVTGAELDKVVENPENSDGGLTRAEHAGIDTARVHDHGITPKDFENQSAQRVIRQDVKKPGNTPGLNGPDMNDGGKTGGTLLSYDRPAPAAPAPVTTTTVPPTTTVPGP